MAEDFVIEMLHITKEFPGIKANDDITLQLRKGEVHALLGENGAGKSTLMSVLFGLYQPEEGKILKNGKEVAIRNPNDANALGIGMVHQHFKLVECFSVLDNIILGVEPNKMGFLQKAEARKKVMALSEKYGLRVDPDALISDISVGMQQRVEILKAIYRGANILILDEPTAVLTPQEVEELFVIMRNLKKDNKSIIIITHKLKETLAIADRISVLRDGKMVESGLPLDNVTTSDLAKMMVGRDVELNVRRENTNMGEAFFQIQDLKLSERGVQVLKGISLSIRKGEILGVAGIEGNGQTELIEVLTGLRKADSGTMMMGTEAIHGDAHAFLKHKIGHIPEDRLSRGLVTEMSIEDNLILGYHDEPQFLKQGLLQKKNIQSYAEEAVGEYMIKTPNARELVSSLSGGNQQKVVIARVFKQNPDVLIVAQPTRGVDVGAMEYIHHQLLRLRDEGKAILLISADLDEVRSLSDRIAVIYDGRIVSVQQAEDTDELSLGLLMTGGKEEHHEQAV